MKELLMGIILTLSVLMAETAFAETPGDVDGNNKVELNDAVMALQATAGIRNLDDVGLALQATAGIRNLDDVGLDDAVQALQVLTGLRDGSPTATHRIPDTGQTKCYDSDGNEINCAGTGQDGEFSINPMSYTKLDTGGNELPDSATSWAMVRDNVTGLIWEVKGDADGEKNYSNPNDPDNTYTWYDSNLVTNGRYARTEGDGTDTQDFINAMNAANYGGYNDWRMPDPEELRSLVDYNIAYSPTGPAIYKNYFPNAQRGHHWASVTDINNTNNAWRVDFIVGVSSNANYLKSTSREYVRAVRGRQPRSSDSLVIDPGGKTVTDQQTGLMWEIKENMDDAPNTANPHDADNRYTWQETLDRVTQLNAENFGGYSDWRLPTVKELASLADLRRSPVVPQLLKDTTKLSGYWSSANHVHYTDWAWCVFFNDGYTVGCPKSGEDNGYFRAVRGGQ